MRLTRVGKDTTNILNSVPLKDILDPYLQHQSDAISVLWTVGLLLASDYPLPGTPLTVRLCISHLRGRPGFSPVSLRPPDARKNAPHSRSEN